MKLTIIAKSSAKEQRMEKVSEGVYKISVKEPAKEGRANWAVERVLAEHFKVVPSRVRILSGHTSRKKIVEIL